MVGYLSFSLQAWDMLPHKAQRGNLFSFLLLLKPQSCRLHCFQKSAIRSKPLFQECACVLQWMAETGKCHSLDSSLLKEIGLQVIFIYTASLCLLRSKFHSIMIWNSTYSLVGIRLQHYLFSLCLYPLSQHCI